MSTTAAIDPTATDNEQLLSWVDEIAALTAPDQVVFCDGSTAERERLTAKLVQAGTLVPLGGTPGAFRCAPDAADVAQVGQHSYVCSRLPDAAGWANWMEPVDMRIILTEEFRNSMTGRTLYVVPFHTRGTPAVQGVQLTDSEYVVVCMSMVARDHHGSIGKFDGTQDFVRCLHSVGAPRREDRADVAWPCDTTQYIVQFPETQAIWSYGSGFAGSAFLAGQQDGSGFWFGLAGDHTVDVVESELWRTEIALMEACHDRSGTRVRP